MPRHRRARKRRAVPRMQLPPTPCPGHRALVPEAPWATAVPHACPRGAEPTPPGARALAALMHRRPRASGVPPALWAHRTSGPPAPRAAGGGALTAHASLRARGGVPGGPPYPRAGAAAPGSATGVQPSFPRAGAFGGLLSPHAAGSSGPRSSHGGVTEPAAIPPGGAAADVLRRPRGGASTSAIATGHGVTPGAPPTASRACRPPHSWRPVGRTPGVPPTAPRRSPRPPASAPRRRGDTGAPSRLAAVGQHGVAADRLPAHRGRATGVARGRARPTTASSRRWRWRSTRSVTRP